MKEQEYNKYLTAFIHNNFACELINEASHLGILQGVDFTLCRVQEQVYFGVCDASMPEWFTTSP